MLLFGILFLLYGMTVEAQKPSIIDKPIPASVSRTPKADDPIIIVGGYFFFINNNILLGGLAGLSAAITAIEAGSKIILLDKEADLGGNSAKARINGCDTKVQKEMNIVDSTDKFYTDTMVAGDRENDQALVDVLVHESSSAVEFLIENGVELADINLCGGHSSSKEGKPLPVGVAIIRALKAKLYSLKEKFPENIEIRLSTPVVGLVTWNDFITGIRYKNSEGKVEEITGKAVILSSGGFSSDRDNATSLITEFASSANILNLPTTNGAFATGDGVKMARAMGAGLVGMKHIQVHPTAFVDPKDPAAKTKFLAAEALRGKGAILLNEKGERFGNELGRRDELSDKIVKNCAKNPQVDNLPTAFMVMDNKSADDFGRPAFNFYANIKKFFTEVANVQGLAEHINCDVNTLTNSIKEYNQYANKDNPGKDSFGKHVFPVAFDLKQPFYVATITPAIHYTMGGLKIDKQVSHRF